ncbi:MAG: LysM peptidoglycan-binding domain-containing protein [Cyanobacteria bacterium HKST-UBA02]|nr:LysM peptidoglycan-binding domain-containing protein [Cyanobacteria bacterium HKST-UBA02]
MTLNSLEQNTERFQSPTIQLGQALLGSVDFETFSSLSKTNNFSEAELPELNLVDPRQSARAKERVGGVPYVVKPGETLTDVARSVFESYFATEPTSDILKPLSTLIDKMNHLNHPILPLEADQTLRVPTADEVEDAFNSCFIRHEAQEWFQDMLNTESME